MSLLQGLFSNILFLSYIFFGGWFYDMSTLIGLFNTEVNLFLLAFRRCQVTNNNNNIPTNHHL